MKQLLIIFNLILFFSISTFSNAQQSTQIDKKFQTLEKDFDGKIGIYALNTNNNQIIAYRADERFPIQSTMKLLAIAALIKKSENAKHLLQEKIHYTKDDLVFWGLLRAKT